MGDRKRRDGTTGTYSIQGGREGGGWGDRKRGREKGPNSIQGLVLRFVGTLSGLG